MKPTAAEHRAIAARAKRIAATVRPWAPTAVSPADVVRAAIEEGWGTVARTLTEALRGQKACGHRPTAGWIVGQWLKYGFPGVDRFVDDWRAKFGGAS